MNRFKKALVSLGALGVIGCAIPFGGTAQAAAPDVKVQVNDALVRFPDADPFLDASGRLQVPVRFVTEKLGGAVDWKMIGSTGVDVTIRKGDTTIRIVTGSSKVYVNGVQQTLDTTPFYKNDRVYVPFRFIAETFGTMVQWDDRNWIAILCADGKYHAPAWYAPNPAAEVVASAKTYVGVPYVWGGTTPRGFDCSGFVRYVFQQKGMELPRTSRELYAQSGTTVRDLREGDLVFFASGSVNHVGIYIGSGRFISATSSYGIHIDNLSSTYWGPRYVGAKRVI